MVQGLGYVEANVLELVLVLRCQPFPVCFGEGDLNFSIFAKSCFCPLGGRRGLRNLSSENLSGGRTWFIYWFYSWFMVYRTDRACYLWDSTLHRCDAR